METQGGDGHRHSKTGPVPADPGRGPCRGQLDFRPLASRAVWEERSAGFVPVAARRGRQGWGPSALLSPEPVLLCTGDRHAAPDWASADWHVVGALQGALSAGRGVAPTPRQELREHGSEQPHP